MSLKLALDYGTTNSVACAVLNGVRCKVMPVDAKTGEVLFPSVVYLSTDGDVSLDPTSTHESTHYHKVHYSKLLQGVSRSRYARDEQFYLALAKSCNVRFHQPLDPEDQYMLISADEDNATPISPVFCMATIMVAMLTRFRNEFAGTVTVASLTVPVRLPPDAREIFLETFRQAAQVLGNPKITVHLMLEPVAAALNAKLDLIIPSGVSKEDSAGKLPVAMVVDMGGGTTDISLLVPGELGTYVVLAHGGDLQFGGRDADLAIADRKLKDLDLTRKDLTSDEWSNLLQLACRIKEGRGGGDDYQLSETLTVPARMSEEEVADALRDFTNRYEELVREFMDSWALAKALQEAGLPPVDRIWDEVQVILVGGSSQLPCVQQRTEDLFPGRVHRSGDDVQTSIAQGAAKSLCAADSANDGTVASVLGTVPYNIGHSMYAYAADETADRQVVLNNIVPQGARLPTRQYQAPSQVSRGAEGSTAMSFCIYAYPTPDGDELARPTDPEAELIAELTVTRAKGGFKAGQKVDIDAEMDQFGHLHLTIHVEGGELDEAQVSIDTQLRKDQHFVNATMQDVLAALDVKQYICDQVPKPKDAFTAAAAAVGTLQPDDAVRLKRLVNQELGKLFAVKAVQSTKQLEQHPVTRNMHRLGQYLADLFMQQHGAPAAVIGGTAGANVAAGRSDKEAAAGEAADKGVAAAADAEDVMRGQAAPAVGSGGAEAAAAGPQEPEAAPDGAESEGAQASDGCADQPRVDGEGPSKKPRVS